MKLTHCLKCAVFCFVVGLAACHTAPPQPPAQDIDARPLWALAWLDDPAAYQSALQGLSFADSGSIEGERYVQAESITRGQRAQLLLDLEAARALAPSSADLAYLEARLLEDPIRLTQRFEELARRWPKHAWIRLGAAGAWLNLDRPKAARAHFESAPNWPDAQQFRNLIASRLLAAEGDPQAWRSLLDDAFVDGSPAALAELAFIAQTQSIQHLAERVESERALRRASVHTQAGLRKLPAKEAWGLVFERARTELAWDASLSFEFFLRQLDAWTASVGLPTGWAAHSSYILPFGAAELLRPELDASPLTRSLAENDWAVLLGGAWLRGTQLLVLSDVERRQVAWPGIEQGVEIWLARGARGSADFTSGGALFRGFYVRIDFVQRAAERSFRQSQAMRATSALTAEELPEIARQLGPRATIPESLDLARRIRAQQCAGSLQRAFDQELAALLLHEAGHLPETLPFTRAQTAWGEAIAMASRSLIEDGWLLAEWEYRAQLRALACPEVAHWALAQLVETAQDPKQPYFRPYRRLLIDLLQVSDVAGAPPLAVWDSVPAAEIAMWAATLAEKRGMELLPRDAVENLLELVQVLEVFE